MAKVLAAVPAHGLETVLGSVKQILDSGNEIIVKRSTVNGYAHGIKRVLQNG